MTIWTHFRNSNRLSFSLALFCALFSCALNSFAQDTVTLVGDFQSELGCSDDWLPDCADTHMTYDAGNDIYSATFSLPPGDWEYKVAINNGWDENYGDGGVAGGDNITISLTDQTDVTFYYDHKTNYVTDSLRSILATVPGDYQAHIGCAAEWRPECMRSWLQDPDRDGIYSFSVPMPAGSYNCKVALDLNWTVNYGVDGVVDGADIPFTVGPSETVTFNWDSDTKILSIETAVVVSDDSTVTVVGSLQDELGCEADWDPACENTQISFDEEDLVWQGSFTLPAGDYEYKVALDGTWDESYGGPDGANVALSLAEEREVKFYYSTNSNYVTDNASSTIATLAGNFQSLLGCGSDWDPSCLRTLLEDPDRDGIYTFTTAALPFGIYETKVAINEGWDENYGMNGALGGDNVPFLVPGNNIPVIFSWDSATKVLTVTADNGGGGPISAPDARYAIFHYNRADGDYGDHTTGDYNDFWGLHLWGSAVDASDQTDWTQPKPFIGQTAYGRFALIKLSGESGTINYIVHRGDVKDGTEDDRAFNPNEAGSYEVFLLGDDGNNYASAADVTKTATIRYHRMDGNYGVDTAAYWGLHLWSDGGNTALDPAAETAWDAPRAPDGVDEFGAYWHVPLNPNDPGAASKPLPFIIHTPSGDNTDPGGDREPGGDRSFVPAENSTIWVVEQDETNHVTEGSAMDFVIIHYHRPDGDYGNYESDDYNDFWGVHVWDGAVTGTEWTAPIKAAGFDSYGPYFKIPVTAEATELAYIIHRGDTKDPDPDQRLNLTTVGNEIWHLNGAEPDLPIAYPVISVAPTGVDAGSLSGAEAFWLTGNTILWDAPDPNASVTLHWSPTANLNLTEEGIINSEGPITLTPTSQVDPYTLIRYPHLIGLPAFEIPADQMGLVPAILRSQIAISNVNADGQSMDATAIQIPAVLDDLFAYDGKLGIDWVDTTPVFRVWAPTARDVHIRIFDSPEDTEPETHAMESLNGTWEFAGDPSMKGKYYQYGVFVYVPSTQTVETNIVTDPYSVALSRNSTMSAIVDLNDAAFKPEGWDSMVKPALDAPEDITLYEMHIRDFSMNDASVEVNHKGKYKAFTLDGTHGMNHLEKLAEAGLTHLHLLPAFDIATVNEDESQRIEPDAAALEAAAADSDEQQALINAIRDQDGFNWGYDPYHYTVPEGSYAIDPVGGNRTLEFREMVSALNSKGLRVVMDVVYNHTSASGQNPQSVLDKVVPGYYHRLNRQGGIERSTCCENTASEHKMMEKLMVDSLIVWAKYYKIDAFRFDLMGHHMVENMQAVVDALHGLTLENDGVDGSKIYIYGEGWNFGEVGNNARGLNATQLNVGGMGIGTFSDRLRDAVRGGGPFDGGELLKTQGFANGLGYDPNDLPQGDAYAGLLQQADRIRVGLTGNLANFTFIDRSGSEVTGAQVDYNGQPAGYTLDPQEVITYVSKHDNQTLYDINVYGAPVDTSMDERVRMQALGLALVTYAQGVPFYHAGVDLMRSKSLDRNSYNSGDWFNRIDWTYQDNNYGVGLPPQGDNGDNYFVMQPLLANPDLVPSNVHIEKSAAMFQDMLRIRKHSPLLRLRTADDVMERVSFHNTGPNQIGGVIAMHIDDTVGDDLDSDYIGMMVVFNATTETQNFNPGLVNRKFDLHPVQMDGSDETVKAANYDRRAGVFSIPARTAAVFVETVPPTPMEVITTSIDAWVADGTLNQRQADFLLRLANWTAGNAGTFYNYLVNAIHRYVDQGLLTDEQAAILLEAAGDLL